MKNPELLHTASEQFLGKKEHEIKSTVLQTLEGHLRAILGTLTVEEVYKDRDQFASLVREVAAPDVGRMGIEILSFTIKDVYDNVTYLQSLGKAQTAAVKRDAEIGVAQVDIILEISIQFKLYFISLNIGTKKCKKCLHQNVVLICVKRSKKGHLRSKIGVKYIYIVYIY